MRQMILLCLLCMCVSAPVFAQSVPVVTDSRIRTLVYNPNEVFTVVAHYGFQSNIEFAKGEEIETISLGDQVAWQIVPAGRHIFIRPLTKQAATNMTVITTRRIYHFDLKARPQTRSVDENLSYVTRFYYPDEHVDQLAGSAPAPAPAAPAPAPMRPAPVNVPLSAPVPPPPPMMPRQADAMAPSPMVQQGQAVPVPRVQAEPIAPASSASLEPMMYDGATSPAPLVNNAPIMPMQPMQQPFNFAYSLSGPERMSPVKVFDDGSQVFLQYTSAADRRFFLVDPTGAEIPVPTQSRNGFTIIPTLSEKIIQRNATGEMVCIFNDAMVSSPMAQRMP